MIFVIKGSAPKVLVKRAAAAHAALIAKYDDDPLAYRNKKKMKFNDGLYGHIKVRESLETAQYGKCCYCEVLIPTPYALRHVEHFRPKSLSQQEIGAPEIWPGYFWLVYEWSNLYLSCGFCNSSHKRNFFPINDIASRALGPGDDVTLEGAVLLDPGGTEDPRDHIKFHDEVVLSATERGNVNISILGLDDPLRDEARLKRLAEIRKWLQEIRLFSGHIDPEVIGIVANARQSLSEATMPHAPFSAMAQDYLAKNPIP